jgi:hypothetical protein
MPIIRTYQLQQQQPLVYRRNVVIAVLLVSAAVDRFLMMGIRMPETC